jgi:glycosyl transferase family 25
MTPRAFIISLAREKDRREKAIHEADAAGLDYEVVDAIDARDYKTANGRVLWKELKEAYTYRDDAWGVPFTASEVCIFHSHLMIYRKIVAEKLDWAIILEDDFQLCGGTSYGMHEVADDLDALQGKWLHATLHAEFPDWNIAKVRGNVNENLNIVRPCPLVTVAYAVTQRMARHMLKYFSEMDAPIDHVLQRVSNNPNVTFLMTAKPICEQTHISSTQE